MSKKTVTITVSQTDVYNEVDKHTSYAGAKADASLHDKVRAKSQDQTMLERWWADACGMVTTLLVPYATGIGFTTGGFAVTLSLPSNWNSAQKTVLTDAMEDIVCDYILRQWYLLLGMDAQAKTAAEKTTAAAAKVATALYDRVRPTRPTYNLGHIGEAFPKETKETKENG